jgi:predicted ABC-type ATPase
MADLDRYDLVDLNSAVESYFTDITSGKSPVENPKGYILGGQGGAGKSTIHNIVKEQEPNTVVINGDEFRELHPNFEKIADVYGEKAANHTQSFANAVANALIEKLSNDGYNIIIEGTCRRADVPMKSCNDLKEKGYTVELSIMCTDKETAWNSTIDRYNEMKAQGMFARAVPREKYEETVKALPKNIEVLYRQGIFDEITLYNRNRKCLYRMSETPNLSPSNIVDNVLNNTEEVKQMDIDYEVERMRDMGHTDDDHQAEYDEALEDYENGTPFPDDEYHRGVQTYRKIREENGYVLAVEVYGRHHDEYQYATWQKNEYGRGLDFGHYFLNNKDEALIDFKTRAGLDLLDVKQMLLDESMLSENVIHIHPKNRDFPEIVIDFSDNNVVVKVEGEYPLPQKLFDWNESVADLKTAEIHRIVNEKMFVLFPTDDFEITSEQPRNYDDYRLRVSEREQDEYMEFLRDKVEEVFGADGYYEIFWDYRDEISADEVVEAIENYQSDGYESVRDYLSEKIYERNIDADWDCICDIESAVQNCENADIIRAYKMTDSFVDDLQAAGYNGIDPCIDDLLSRSDFKLNVMFATANEKNMDMTSIVNSYGSYWSPDLDRIKTVDLDNSLTYLIHQQGHTVEEVYDCLHGNPTGFGSDEPTDFVKSVVNEIVNNSSSAMSELTALIKVNGSELDEFIKKINEGKENIKLDKRTMVGIYNEYAGGGSVLEIELEKDLVIPTSMVQNVEIEHRGGNTLDSVYCLDGSAWRETSAESAFTDNEPDLKQENLQQTLDNVRAKFGNTQEQEQSKGR